MPQMPQMPQSPIYHRLSAPSFFDNLNELLANKQHRVTVKGLAQSSNISIAAMRKILLSHYGNRIAFSKGRTGGIVLITKPQTASNNATHSV